MELENSLPLPQELATGLYSEAVESISSGNAISI
jgi:hypothetical protein